MGNNSKRPPVIFDRTDLENKIQIPADGFSPERFKVSQNYADGVNLKKVLTTVPLRRPDRQTFFRVHPNESYRMDVFLLDLKENRESYLVEGALYDDLGPEISHKRIYTIINPRGDLSLWSIRVRNTQGGLDAWSQSAHDAALHAMEKWIRIIPNHSLGAYEIFEANGDFPDPKWPDYDFFWLLQLAFKDRIISSMDHPVIRLLKGQK